MDLESVLRKVLKWAMRERHTNIGPGECTKESVEMGNERETLILDLESTKESVEMDNERETHQYWTWRVYQGKC